VLIYRNWFNIIYLLLTLFPYYLFDLAYGYLRLLLLVEYSEINILILGIVRVLCSLVDNGLLRYCLEVAAYSFGRMLVYLLICIHVLTTVYMKIEDSAGIYESSDFPVDLSTRYITTFYYICTTATTVGYGDVLVNHQWPIAILGRYSYQVFLMLMAVVGNGIFLSMILSTTRSFSEAMRASQEAVQEFEDWMAVYIKNMNKSTQVNRYFKAAFNFFKFNYYFNIGQSANYNQYLERALPEESEEIKKAMTRGAYEKFQKYFEMLSDDVSQQLVLAMQPMM